MCAQSAQAGEDDNWFTLSIPARLKRVGLGTKMIIQGARSDEPDASLIKVLIKAHEFWYKLVNGDGSSIAELARRVLRLKVHIHPPGLVPTDREEDVERYARFEGGLFESEIDGSFVQRGRVLLFAAGASNQEEQGEGRCSSKSGLAK